MEGGGQSNAKLNAGQIHVDWNGWREGFQADFNEERKPRIRGDGREPRCLERFERESNEAGWRGGEIG